MKFYFPLHFDGDNRGCEGIAKGTAVILNCGKENLVGYCRNVQLDAALGIDKFFTLIAYKPLNIVGKVLKKIDGLFNPTISKVDLYFKYQYAPFLKKITIDDVMVSTGGDMLCYGNNMVNTTNNILSKKGIKTILWGCSMGPENYTDEKFNTLQKFDLIYVRESLTYSYFRSLGLKNVVCLPDPAFVLSDENVNLPTIFIEHKVIGINISPYVYKNEKFKKDFMALINYILDNTLYSILFVPHVLWTDQDDRVVSMKIVNEFKTKRINVLKSEKYNYLQIRHIIGNCELFIGGRTHSVISAYSMCVPTIALGYSIKSKGIAKDLGLDSRLVVDTIKGTSDIFESFDYLEKNKVEIRNHLLEVIPDYKEQPFLIRNFIKNIF